MLMREYHEKRLILEKENIHDISFMKYYLFNPENDLALSLGEKHYNPPKSILRFSEDLSMLPLWYAKEGGCVLSRQCVPDGWMKSVRQSLGLSASWMHEEEYGKNSHPTDRLLPWGWNTSLYNHWKKIGVSDQVVDCATLRELSSRALVCEVLSLPYFQEHVLPKSFILPKVLRSMEEVCTFVESQPKSVLKAPWSSSGKGLYWTLGERSATLEKWTKNILLRQGYVMGEAFYEKVVDFAMEFTCHGSSASFLGYSFFLTENGRYKGNILQSDDRLEERLTQYVRPEVLRGVSSVLCEFFSSVVSPHYEGALGVDMMVIRVEGEYYLHPCVEVNLRMNMGVVSHTLFHRFMRPDAQGEFFVLSFPSNGDLRSFHEQNRKGNPLQICDGKVEKGYLPLTFIDDQCTSLAGMIVE